jgi:small conductance mechanosensitive channel
VPEPVCTPDAQWCILVNNVTGSESLAKAADWLIAKPLGVLVLVIAALVIRWLAVRLIDRVVRRAGSGTVPAVLPRSLSRQNRQKAARATRAAGERRQQRAETMGSVLRSLTTVVIVVITGFMAVSQLGYNIAPLIASAGVVGVAVGFGAQSLVRDFLSGIFMIMEDQYGVGDWVTINDITGEVEAVGLRVTRVRDLDGVVWYLRNGEIFTAGNLSQYWGRTVLDVQVGYGEDLDVVKETLLDVARELARDPEFAEQVLGEPEVWGVQSLESDRVMVRLALTTEPAVQWSVARELRARIKVRFQADHIEIPLPQYVQHAADAPSRT